MKLLRIDRSEIGEGTTIREICEQHRADLRGADLRGADLRWAYLRGADLRWAYLRGADLRWACLQGADLRWADLRWAYLRWAYLRGADLRWADLRWACLQGADLRGADLRWAYLRGADLQGAHLDVFPVEALSSFLAGLPPDTVLNAWKYLVDGCSPYRRTAYATGESYEFADCSEDRFAICAPGGNVAPLIWCWQDAQDQCGKITFIEVEFLARDLVCPYLTDGKFRVRRFRVLRSIEGDEVLRELAKAGPEAVSATPPDTEKRSV